jgi:hypothetical protein
MSPPLRAAFRLVNRPPGWVVGRTACAARLWGGVGCVAYTWVLDEASGVRVHVRFRTRRSDVTDYALVLVTERDGRSQTVRVYDSAHGHNEMHRYTRKLGKRRGEVFHRGTLGEGMRFAQQAIKDGYEEMIDGWR